MNPLESNLQHITTHDGGLVADGGKSETCHETASAVCRRMEYGALHKDF